MMNDAEGSKSILFDEHCEANKVSTESALKLKNIFIIALAQLREFRLARLNVSREKSFNWK